MIPNLEAIKGGGGSIKVGTTGTISILMSREIENSKPIPHPSLPPIKISISTESVSVPCQALTPRRLKQKPSTNGESTSENGTDINKKISDKIGQKVKPHNQRSSQLPMLETGDASLQATPPRKKADKRGGSHIVHIVDIKCGHPDRAWATPITSRLKKLGFSKLSENTIVLSAKKVGNFTTVQREREKRSYSMSMNFSISLVLIKFRYVAHFS